MADTIVVLKDAAFAPAFMEAAKAIGLVPQTFIALPRHFIFRNVRLADLPLVNHPAVLSANEDQHNLKAEAAQDVTLNQDMTGTGGWPASRVIRRADPWWQDGRGVWPRASKFDCVRTGAGVDIFMIDSGCEYNHPEFGGRVSQYRHENTSYSTAERDNSGHGSHCLGCAIGRTVGIAREARGHSIKFHNSNSGGSESNAISAMAAVIFRYNQMAADDRPAVMFMSWSGFGAGIDAAVTDMINAGIVCCFPAANDAQDIDTQTIRPAESDPDTIVCGGLQLYDYLYFTPATGFGTNYGPIGVDIFAPAQRTLSVQRISAGGGLRLGDGTSYATPIVAGVVACMLQGYKRLTTRAEVQAVKAKLQANASTGIKPTRITNGPWMTFTDRIVYLDPKIPFEVISGLTPRVP